MLLRIQQRYIGEYFKLADMVTNMFFLKAQLWFIKYVHDKNVPDHILAWDNTPNMQNEWSVMKFLVCSFAFIFR